jgi:hypothetical protein
LVKPSASRKASPGLQVPGVLLDGVGGEAGARPTEVLPLLLVDYERPRIVDGEPRDLKSALLCRKPVGKLPQVAVGRGDVPRGVVLGAVVRPVLINRLLDRDRTHRLSVGHRSSHSFRAGSCVALACVAAACCRRAPPCPIGDGRVSRSRGPSASLGRHSAYEADVRF